MHLKHQLSILGRMYKLLKDVFGKLSKRVIVNCNETTQ